MPHIFPPPLLALQNHLYPPSTPFLSPQPQLLTPYITQMNLYLSNLLIAELPSYISPNPELPGPAEYIINALQDIFEKLEVQAQLPFDKRVGILVETLAL